MTTSTDRGQQIQKLRELIGEISCGMLTTIDQNGRLHSCPMYKSGDINSEGAIWFFTSANTQKVNDIQRNQQVNVSFTSPRTDILRWCVALRDNTAYKKRIGNKRIGDSNIHRSFPAIASHQFYSL
ncbi:pyridoxamine 5'-phosphate oxidase family protein [Nodularia spumigena]|uniref:pyridoxamine 5'-phosphate oxidase family protein n=1 Tax=Nodularia spumigena TaxID=70799 RepID=UPI0022869F38|nr:pyridoxamine 5'-phosphate oxidase family protein [Nodularia spumigena]